VIIHSPKVLICPYFGEQPEWMDHYWKNAQRLESLGYDFLLDTDEEDFRDRVNRILGIECPKMTGTGNIWDFRPALGELYAEEIKGYEWWGHTDFDCVYGRVENWITEEFLEDLDIHSNHRDYICGFWTLYRNCAAVNELFYSAENWKHWMESGVPSGWAETEFTAVVDAFHQSGEINRKYTFWQTKDLNNYDKIHWDGDKLMEGNEEIAMLHFRRTKQYPEGAKIA
jgi:hypothetical protein